MKYSLGIFVALILFSCDTTGVGTSNDKPDTPVQPEVREVKEDSLKVDLQGDHEIVDEKTLENGVKLKWFQHGDGDVIQGGEMIDIDYKVLLDDGTVIDGNHLRNMSSFPYMVGFGMQPGWDFAMKELKVGDFVEVFLPAEVARGEKEIEGLMPKNSNNTLRIHVLSRTEPTRIVDGTRVWLMNENKANTELFGEDKRIYFHCWISSPSNPHYYNTQINNNPFNYQFGDPGLTPGLRKALNNAKKADMMLVHVPAEEAYGSKGYLDLVKPNEDLFYSVFVMEVK